MLRTRRDFLADCAAIGTAAAFGALTSRAWASQEKPKKEDFKISLAEWSIHKSLFAKKIDNRDFAAFAKEKCGIEAIEYVNQFFKDKARDEAYLAELNRRAADHGVRQLLIMCDGEGDLGDPDVARRQKAVENHHRWVDAAKTLGCHSIRVNVGSKGTPEEQHKLVVDGLGRLAEYGAKNQINVIVENHGGLSSNGAWLAGVIKEINSPYCGTLPDFGNFHDYDRYKGVTELMPFAKAVSAKSHDFDAEGNETKTDYLRMCKIVLDAGYRGYFGIEYEGSRLNELDGIMATKRLLERVREQLTS